MSEPHLQATHQQQDATSPTEEEIIRGGEETVTATAPPAPLVVNTTTNDDDPQLTSPVKTLKDAFPDLDIEVIETILQSQGGNLDAAFEVLLGMSDPSYKPEPVEMNQQVSGMNQLRQDEEYARRLAREGEPHYPQNQAATNESQQPLFNFQEELPIIKEKVIEVGTAAKNKIMNLYNQFMAGPAESSNNNNRGDNSGGVLETGMGNLSVSDNYNPPRQQALRPSQQKQGSYEWDDQVQAPIGPRDPVFNHQPTRTDKITTPSATSTPTAQMLSDEEFARQLAREDAEAAETAAAIATVHQSELHSPVMVNNTRRTEEQHDEVTLSAINDKSIKENAETKPTTTASYTLTDNDDLDDLFNKHDEEENKSTTTAAATVKKE